MAYDAKLPHENCRDLMTVDEYIDCVDQGGFIDYDGCGYPVKDGLMDESIIIYPSDHRLKIPKDATHICWFNR